jgi:hypothetical protein
MRGVDAFGTVYALYGCRTDSNGATQASTHPNSHGPLCLHHLALRQEMNKIKNCRADCARLSFKIVITLFHRNLKPVKIRNSSSERCS